MTEAAHDRGAVWLAIAGITALSWLYLWRLAARMDQEMIGMADMVMPRSDPWSLVDIAMTFAMWAVMMAGMMLPGVGPTLALFAALDRKRRSGGRSASTVSAFGAGYLAVWTAFSVAATLLQWALDSALLLTMAQAAASSLLAATFLIAAGLYQLTPMKHACLTQCRSPLGFLMAHWRNGRVGAFRMGVRHGAWCLGCCGVLMLLLFVGGVMNLAWAAALALLTMAEKIIPRGERVAQGFGVLLVSGGAWVAFRFLAA